VVDRLRIDAEALGLAVVDRQVERRHGWPAGADFGEHGSALARSISLSRAA
jgi:hypothetical protein